MVIKTGPDGTTYKAQFENGLVCDVKRAKSSEQRKDDFLKEVQLLGRLHHRHVVRLLGFSDEVNRFVTVILISTYSDSLYQYVLGTWE